MSAVVIPERDLRRLAGVASRMASDHDGEALNATRMAVRTLERFGFRIGDVIERGVAPVAPAAQPRAAATRRSRTPREPRQYGVHAAQAMECLSEPHLWNERESEFLRSMAGQRRAPSPRQGDWLDALVRRFTTYVREAA